jgi:signal transduction histidine kinase
MIDAYAREQSQAWTNLINNAVDAMCGSGTLRVTTRVENGEVVIEIGDTGPGIPHRYPRARSKRHGGKISIDSRPRETILCVELPVRQSEPR